MKKALVISLLFAAALFAQNYKIVGPAEPKPHEATAIKDLTEYLAKRVKGDLTIGGKKNITFYVGDTQLAESLELTSIKLPDERWVVKSFGEQVVINGGGQHGALYATYHFLEDCCNIHWWSDHEEYVPPASPLDLPALDMSGKPYFIYRNIHRGSNKALEITAIRNRLNANGAHVRGTAAVGGTVDYGRPGWAHTYSMYIAKDEFFDAHPEYFALIAGERRPGPSGQLCLSNPDLSAIFAKKMCDYIEQDRAVAAKNGVPYPIYYEVSMNDNTTPCVCDACKEYAEQYGYSAQLIEFLNDISRRVTPKYPDIYISTLAYYFTDTPPKKDIKTEKNIVIRLCDTTTNQALSILHPDNAKFKSYVQEWGKFTDYLSIWDYAVTYDDRSIGSPFASEFYYGDLYKHYRDNNVKGIFWEHEYEYKADMFEYKFFLECKLLEDPDADVEKLQELFLTKYYGAAAPLMMEYRRIVDRACHDNNGNVPFAISLSSFNYLTNPILKELDALMDKAEATVAGDAQLVSRIRRARLGIDRLIVQRRHLNSHGNVKGGNVRLDTKSAMNRLENDWRRWTERYLDKAAFLENIDKFMANVKTMASVPQLDAPEYFKGKAFYYFQPVEFKLFGKNGVVVLVDDVESPSGKAARVIGSASHYYKLPFEMGCYDLSLKKTSPTFSAKSVADRKGYNWYKMGRATIPQSCDLFFNRAWTIQLPVAYPETIGRTYDVWASLKFTGPMYQPDDKEGESYMFLGLVVLEEVRE
ncbi:MAG: DUF4838 domain-containing protein [Victivallales bacterium]|nr:DUF4838 domain-containing protein [Victivallales bacterium]